MGKVIFHRQGHQLKSGSLIISHVNGRISIMRLGNTKKVLKLQTAFSHVEKQTMNDLVSLEIAYSENDYNNCTLKRQIPPS